MQITKGIRAYYNDSDPKICAWLRELIKAELITPGEVDERPIEEVQPSDVLGFDRCHFFAGIGGWDYALNLAGWGARSVWTGSCPCQPWSVAGSSQGADDPRHLWPAWKRLIEVARPSVVFGEQVASKDGLYWLDLVYVDLEAQGYAVGAFDLPACGVGAPHLRHRLWFVGYADSPGLQARNGVTIGDEARPAKSSDSSAYGELADAYRGGLQIRRAGCVRSPSQREAHELRHLAQERRDAGDMADATGRGFGINRGTSRRSRHLDEREQAHWAAAEWVQCSDGKSRPVEPGTFPLAHGVPARVGRLRGYGNAIVAPLAAEFIGAYMDVVDQARANRSDEA